MIRHNLPEPDKTPTGRGTFITFIIAAALFYWFLMQLDGEPGPGSNPQKVKYEDRR